MGTITDRYYFGKEILIGNQIKDIDMELSVIACGGEHIVVMFFEESYKEVLSLCGKVSGRETDKIKECNLTTNYYKGIPYFEEASLVLICSTLYQNTISKEGFQDEKMIDTYYPDNDFHEMYIGKIEAVLKK